MSAVATGVLGTQNLPFTPLDGHAARIERVLVVEPRLPLDVQGAI
jgi:hypothetical protein